MKAAFLFVAIFGSLLFGSMSSAQKEGQQPEWADENGMEGEDQNTHQRLQPFFNLPVSVLQGIALTCSLSRSLCTMRTLYMCIQPSTGATTCKRFMP